MFPSAVYSHYDQDFVPIVDSITKKVIHIDFPACYKKRETESVFDPAGLNVDLSRKTTAPLPLSEDTFEGANRKRIPPPQKSYDFLPDLLEKDGMKFRDNIKPLHIIQPEGVSFKMDGNVIEWQKWKMHIGEFRRAPSS